MVKLSDIDLPMIFKNKLLFSHGIHNDLSILPEEVSKSLLNTDWNDQRNRSLFFSHSDRDAQKWIGRINNPQVVNGELFGDLEIHDADLALKLGPGKAPIGVSAEIRWPMQYPNPTNFSYRGFAMVPNPEVPETMINFSKIKEDGFNSATIKVPFKVSTVNFSENNVDEKVDESIDNDTIIVEEDEDEAEFAKITAMEEKRKQMGLSVSQFYAAPRNPPSESALPIFDAAHVRNALARFNQTKFLSESEKNKAHRKIISAAKKFGIGANKDFSENVEESNLMSAERGLEIKMENNTNNVEEEVKEDTVEETKEVEAEVVEESKKADFSEIKSQIESLSARVIALEEKQAKFSEIKEEEEEEVKETEKESKPEVEEVKEEPESEKESEETKEEVVEEVKEKEVKADFSEVLVSKIDKLVEVMTKKEAAPMSTAEFGATGIDKGSVIVDRLTKSLSN